jgi:RNA polymerase sigma factor (sigma-70 family)
VNWCARSFRESSGEAPTESWRATLAAGDKEGAWRDFIARYRRLIIATVRRTIGNDDDVDDIFAEVCANLSADDLARLKRHSETGTARLSTWLVTVVHHQTIDWVRQREGRHRVRTPAGLSSLQNLIFKYVFDERRSHVEAYELIQQRGLSELSFADFLKEVAETYHVVERAVGKAATHYLPGPPVLSEGAATVEDEIIAAERAGQLNAALQVLPSDERLAIQLFVVDDVGADRVARIVGWPNAKAVYNRVYRALQVLRKELERAGVDRTDQ